MDRLPAALLRGPKIVGGATLGGELARSVLKALRQPMAANPPQEPMPAPRAAQVRHVAENAPKSGVGEPPVSPSANEAQRAAPRANDAPPPPELTVPVQPLIRGGQGGASRTGLLIAGAVANALVVAAGVSFLQWRSPPGIPAAPVATTAPATSAAPSPSPTLAAPSSPAPTPTTVAAPASRRLATAPALPWRLWRRGRRAF